MITFKIKTNFNKNEKLNQKALLKLNDLFGEAQTQKLIDEFGGVNEVIYEFRLQNHEGFEDEFDYSKPNVKLACEVYLRRYCTRQEDNKSVLAKICRDYYEWAGTDAEPLFVKYIYDTFGAEGKESFKKSIENFLKPVSERKFFKSIRNDFNKNPFYNNFENGSWQYVYIAEEVQGSYGKQFWTASNCEDGLELTYTRKAFNDFQVGHFYKIRLNDVINNGHFKKYDYEIEEIDEKTWIEKGIFSTNTSY